MVCCSDDDLEEEFKCVVSRMLIGRHYTKAYLKKLMDEVRKN